MTSRLLNRSDGFANWYVVMAKSEDTLILDRPLDLKPDWTDFFKFTWDENLKELVACPTTRLQSDGCLLSPKLKGGVRRKIMSAEILYQGNKIFPAYKTDAIREFYIKTKDEKKHCR